MLSQVGHNVHNVTPSNLGIMWDVYYHSHLGEDVYALHTVGICDRFYDFFVSHITRPPSKYDNSIQFNNGIGMSGLETREVCSDSTQLDISYATFYEGHLSPYGRYDTW